MLLLCYFYILSTPLSENEMSFFDAKEVIEQRSEIEYKNRSLITHNRVREAVIFYYHVDNYFC